MRLGELFEIRYEKQLEDPQSQLAELCSFPGVEAAEAYLQDCGSVIYESPRKSRRNGPIEWNCEKVDLVKSESRNFSFLDGYSFDE